jgi:hypothetical protein
MKPSVLNWFSVLAVPLLSISVSSVSAAVIDNDLTSGTVGYLSVDVDTGGQTTLLNATLDGEVSGVQTDNIVFEYSSYVDVGAAGGGVKLSGTAPASVGDDAVSSSGSFTGDSGNTINWTVTSSIPNGGSLMTNVFEFTAATGSLGAIRLFQYLDEDVFGVSDDVFFTRGTGVSGDLELFTVDDDEKVGLSHGGAYSVAQGLINSEFAGWAANVFDSMRPAITGTGQAVSLTGINAIGSSYQDPQLGLVYGPVDVVSVLAWDVDPEANTATIITTLGGVATIEDIEEAPIPPAALLFATGLSAFAFRARRKQAVWSAG